MTFLGGALSTMTSGVCKPPLADFGGREKREVFICHHSMMQRPPVIVYRYIFSAETEILETFVAHL